MRRNQLSLTDLARAGFSDLERSLEFLREGEILSGYASQDLLGGLSASADPDAAVEGLVLLLRIAPEFVEPFIVVERSRTTPPGLGEPSPFERLMVVFGASTGLREFFMRNPSTLEALVSPPIDLPSAEALRRDLLDSVDSCDGFARLSASFTEEQAWVALRTRYRRQLARIAAYDLALSDPVSGVDAVAATLADLAASALDASLAVARARFVARAGSDSPTSGFSRDEVVATRLAIVGMGKAGARELNYVSDVDVIFVAEGNASSGLSDGRAVDIATRLAMSTMRGIASPGLEPALWEVDANLRPEGKAGVLVRTLESHKAYYERWAKSWEFQALIKARPLAGDSELGARYSAAVSPLVWSSAAREQFVESVQRMRERVIEAISPDETEFQLKLGPGGLRDIEFTVQLLQLVHGKSDEFVRQANTQEALSALAESGYIGRVEAAEFAHDYRVLRLLEHRLQLRHLRRTHVMPQSEKDRRILARSTGLAPTAAGVIEHCGTVKHRVRTLHERLFYRPLLAVVATTPSDDLNLTSAQAAARLAAIGFENPRGALAHIAALTVGVSRRAAIQRHLAPAILQWFADGADPDYGLLAFRRLSENLGSSYWFLRMLRDSSGAAKRLTTVLSGSRYVGELVEHLPDAVAWLENEEELKPRPYEVYRDDVAAILARRNTPEAAATALRTLRRRECLRLAFSTVLGLCTLEELARGLSDVTTAHLDGTVAVVRQGLTKPHHDDFEFAVVALGRYGGRELGFGSDVDVMYVYRSGAGKGRSAQALAELIVAEIARLTGDDQLPFRLDLGLRPEGKNGPRVRSLDSYRAYYKRWSQPWEAQALLRARGVVGDAPLIEEFIEMADEIRFPATVTPSDLREVRRIKARVESERLPRGADPWRHVKLGRGSLSDVEWLVQLVQLEHGNRVSGLRTTSTLAALDAAARGGLIDAVDAKKLRTAWEFSSRVRSGATLWANRSSDVLPADQHALEGLARILGYPPRSANFVEHDYLAVTRRSRAVFERLFYTP